MRKHPQSRIDYAKDVMKRHKGQIHYFAPFCPLRAAAAALAESDYGSVRETAELVENSGFLGIKLYPLMGYLPWENQVANQNPIPKGFDGLGVTWEIVDMVLRELYETCADEEIPITVHCSPQGSLGPTGAPQAELGPANQAHPSNWAQVVRNSDYKGLRLNLAHWGGDNFQKVTDQSRKDWAEEIVALMSADNAVYSDRSCQIPPSPNKPAEFDPYAARHLQVVQKGSGVPATRMMYGSDWHLALMYPGAGAQVVDSFKKMCGRPGFPPSFKDDFFGGNAARFLGLCQGGRNRDRLDKLYRNTWHLPDGEFPGWWERV